jgi:hypothetical protein
MRQGSSARPLARAYRQAAGHRGAATRAQSIELWHGLRAMSVPTSLVIYDGEGHSIRKPEHQRDQRARWRGSTGT